MDITEYQHPGGASVNWSQIRQSGVTFATLKATRSTNKINSYFRGDLAASLAQGIATAPYHFFTGYSANTAGAQADYFIAELRAAGYTGHRAGELPPILDMEWTDDGTSACPPYTTVSQAQIFLDKVQAAFGVKPWIYTAAGFMTGCMASTTAFGSYGLQVADYGSGRTTPRVPPGWSTWLMWQYADVGSVPGVPTTNVTLNVFNGTQAQLDALAHRDVPPPPAPLPGTLGDFDGDGKQDIAGVAGGDLWIHRNTSTPGNFSTQGTFISSGWGTVGKFMAGDFDADGKDDIIGFNGGDELMIWRSTSTATTFSFAAYKSLGTGWGIFDKLLPLADYDGDGKVDIAGIAGSDLWIHRNTSTPGNFSTTGVFVSTGWRTVSKFMGGDFDADGKSDIIGFNGGDELMIWRSTSTATTFSFAAYKSLGTGWGIFTQFLPLADYDGDGKVDIAGIAGSDLWIHRNTSTPGNFSTTGVFVSTGWRTVSKFMGGDFDADGKSDIIGFNGGDELMIWRSTSTATTFSFAAYKSLGTGWGIFTQFLPLADYDGDGKVDIAGIAGSDLWIHRNTSTPGNFSTTGVFVSTGWRTVTKFIGGDFDADGKSDIIGFNGGDELMIWRSTSTATTFSFAAYKSLGTGWGIFRQLLTTAANN
ncbi:FG-GAP-like repeat-containing protein [Sphaerisporangium album]|uniref:FG-GAP-like repeat-containing protein n=1 Tax=Sphaerisporangium album TaxID=509200 RepID=UPI0015F07CAE|nr:FG-GAP-like repeat-containing protein [Sphaerisporangium album]